MATFMGGHERVSGSFATQVASVGDCPFAQAWADSRHINARGFVMAKGQVRSTKEVRKPKKDKAAKVVKETIKLPEPAVAARGKEKKK
jgi:hypothetical protein